VLNSVKVYFNEEPVKTVRFLGPLQMKTDVNLLLIIPYPLYIVVMALRSFYTLTEQPFTFRVLLVVGLLAYLTSLNSSIPL
jgi:hypothetical protein